MTSATDKPVTVTLTAVTPTAEMPKTIRFFTTEELAKRWGLTPATLRNWRTQKKGPAFVKLGGTSVRYAAEVVEGWEAKQ